MRLLPCLVRIVERGLIPLPKVLVLLRDDIPKFEWIEAVAKVVLAEGEDQQIEFRKKREKEAAWQVILKQSGVRR